MKRLKIATTAVVAASLPVNLLIDFGYSLLSMEVIALALSLAAVGAVIGTVTVNSFLYSYFLALLAYFFAEIYYFNWTTVQSVISLLLFFVLILLLRITGTKFLPYFIIFAVAFSLSAVFKPQLPLLMTSGHRQDASNNLDKSILHIVLDEMASPYGSSFPPPLGHPAQTMLDDLADQGLSVYAQAYPVSVQTIQSLSALVSLDPEKMEYQAFPPGAAIANSVTDNRYMKSLYDAGYEVSILQSNYLDYCAELIDVYCQTYSRVGHVNSFSSAPVGERLKFAFVLLHEAMKSTTRTGVLLYYVTTRLIEESNPVLGSYVPLISYELMQGEVIEQALAIEPGELHFMHLLLPHFPYLYGPDCQRLPIDEWGYPDRHTSTTNTADSYARYWDQVACAKKTLMRILSATADKDFLTTIVHGDHGARVQWLTENEERDDNLKTFLGIRSANTDPGVFTEPVNLQETVTKVLEPFVR